MDKCFECGDAAQANHHVVPKVLVKGGNYSKKSCAEADRIVGEEFVESYGGKVMTAPLIEGVSTTTILERIKNEDADSR